MADPLSVALFAAKAVGTAVKVNKVYQNYQDGKAREASASQETNQYVVPTDNKDALRGNGLYPSGLVVESQDFVIISRFDRGHHGWSQEKIPGNTYALTKCDFINTSPATGGRGGEFWFFASIGTYDVVTKKTTYFRDPFINVFTLPIHNPRTINWSFYVGRRNRLVVAKNAFKPDRKSKSNAATLARGDLKIAWCESVDTWRVENAGTLIYSSDIVVVKLHEPEWHPYIRKALLQVYPSLTSEMIDTIFQS